jgi:hypothetical protein
VRLRVYERSAGETLAWNRRLRQWWRDSLGLDACVDVETRGGR